jgi:hypothetical protein
VFLSSELASAGRWTAKIAGFGGTLLMIRLGHTGGDPNLPIDIEAALSFAVVNVVIRAPPCTEPPNRIRF